jgi:glutamine synthetase
MKVGETVEESASRLIKKELSLSTSKEQLISRFYTVGHYSFVWAKREQEPKENGTADISIVLTITLTKEEEKEIYMDTKEYSNKMWIKPEQIIKESFELQKEIIHFHPALIRATKDLLSMKEWKKLEFSIFDENIPDIEIRKLLKKFIQLKI